MSRTPCSIAERLKGIQADPLHGPDLRSDRGLDRKLDARS